MTDYSIHAKAASLPRTPTYDGKTTASWTPPTLQAYIEAFATDEDSDATQVSQLSGDSKSRIASKTLMGSANASTADGLISFPVVNTDNNLSSQALRSAHQLAYNSPKEAVIERLTERMLSDEFDIELDDTGEDSEAAQTAEATDASGVIETADVSDDGLTGVIWSTGTHPMSLGGKPTRVHVPKSTIKDTFEELEQRVQAGEATIGFDHVEPNSVAANTSLGEIGRMEAIRLSKDEESIVLTKSEITSSRAEQALASGEFNGYDFSFVGLVEPVLDDNGDRVHKNGGVLSRATHIQQVDVVSSGAVQNAQIGRVPALASEVQAHAATEVAESPQNRITNTLQLINSINEHGQ